LFQSLQEHWGVLLQMLVLPLSSHVLLGSQRLLHSPHLTKVANVCNVVVNQHLLACLICTSSLALWPKWSISSLASIQIQ
jgi:hypothetical protein